MENNRSLWKKVLKIAGIVVLVFLLAFGDWWPTPIIRIRRITPVPVYGIMRTNFR